jgi:hypothetical protein
MVDSRYLQVYGSKEETVEENPPVLQLQRVYCCTVNA